MRPEGILLYNRTILEEDASTIMEHVEAFERYSAFPVHTVNTAVGFPWLLRSRRFDFIVLHYSLFGTGDYQLDDRALEFLRSNDGSYRVAFFQDEYQYCAQRRQFIDEFGIHCVYTCVEPEHHQTVYGETSAETIVHTLTGFVSETMLRGGARFARPDVERSVDVAYRARRLPPFMGRGAQEKTRIAEEFQARVNGRLRLDIKTGELERLYGDDWYRFLGNSRGVLGVEAGVSVFDLDDEVRTEYERLLARGVTADADIWRELGPVLDRWEDRVPYRTVSPRHFEAAAFGCVQILFEGGYTGVLEPNVHYLPLAKDFSNLEDVLTRFGSAAERERLAGNARRDLIDSGRFGYRRFIKEFDRRLRSAGLSPVFVSTLSMSARVRGRARSGAASAEARLRRTAKRSIFRVKSRLRRLARPLRPLARAIRRRRAARRQGAEQPSV